MSPFPFSYHLLTSSQSIVRSHRPYITEGDRECSFNSLQEVMHYGSFVASGEEGLPKCIWKSDERCYLDGVLIELDKLRDMMKKQLEKTLTFFLARILLGFAPESVLTCPNHIVDDLRNKQAGYSFIADHRNQFHGVEEAFSHWLVSHPVHGPIFGHVDVEGQFVWNLGAVRDWLKHLQHFKKLLFLLIHLTSGLPQRGTEASETQFANTHTALRNVFAVGTRILIIGAYNKTSHNTGHNKLLPRALHEDVAKLLVWYLALVHPLEKVFAHLVVSKKHLADYSSHLWADTTGTMDNQDFNSILSPIFREHVGCEMNISTWRHLATAISRRHLVKALSSQPDLLKEVVDAIADQQMGHSTEISKLFYAVERPSFHKLSGEEINQFILASNSP